MKVKKVAIVSLSSDVLGEDVVAHELAIGLKRLKIYGLKVEFMPNSLKGLDYIKKHPEKRAEDLLAAFSDDSIDMILCAIGGDDTYRLLPYLFEHDELKEVVRQKIFLGFSDTTKNHLMFNKVGLKTFYGQAFLTDVCELDQEMLPYSKSYFEELINTGTIKEIHPSDVWYEERSDFSKLAVGTPRVSHPNTGFELLRGVKQFTGEILGGCIESLYDFFDNSRYEDTVSLTQKYHLFPSLDEWRGKILLLESSEAKSTPEKYRKMVRALANYGIFDVVNGVLVGQPQDKVYYEEYKNILLEEIKNTDLPIVYNLNIGHNTPRCIIPFGIKAEVDMNQQVINFY
ncbi:LD-carboxypeptidase [Lactobacillus mulieris]|uniref:S66 family peptidase n=1 Tax=Lactobacillus mulieris TaxID=2508708 RepID=UPI0014330373|nr:S66 peptidase family protein [Lactobacillus mulieris]MCF1783036.1 LD-carboxypeptidase [Lactobacillus mulieris]MCW8104581.1 LD-carboxypeptidase [Lactobacillus mulieris]MDK6803431.1 LD-carboxypeptidase [Lactobacillus mulieris]MDK8382404.1 LD-carboxypeptidase [Lactobacillus mulieris]MDT9620731.1 LD-carboxypeptidase [Lactobacillus mulieris]